jgi:hypothetical protein
MIVTKAAVATRRVKMIMRKFSESVGRLAAERLADDFDRDDREKTSTSAKPRAITLRAMEPITVSLAVSSRGFEMVVDGTDKDPPPLSASGRFG